MELQEAQLLAIISAEQGLRNLRRALTPMIAHDDLGRPLCGVVLLDAWCKRLREWESELGRLHE